MQASARTQSGPYQTQSGPYQTQSGPYQTQGGPYQTQGGPYQSQSGPYQSQVGQASQHSQAASQHSDRNGNQIAQRPNASSVLHTLASANGKQPQSVYFIPQNGAYWSGQMPNWQTARAPQQTVSSLQVPAGGRSNNHHQGTFTQDNAAMQASCVNVQSGNHPLPGGINNVPQQASHQNSSLNRPNPSPPNGIQQNSIYLMPGSVSNWNQQVLIQGKQPVVAQDVSANCVPLNRLQRGDVENASYQNVNRIPVQPPPPLPAPATSVQHTHMSYAGPSMSTTTYSQQMAHNHSNGYITNGFQHGVPPHTAAPSQMSSSRPLKSISHVMTSDSSSGQSLMQSTSQQMQRITGIATSSATHPSGSQYSDRRNFPEMNRPPRSIGTMHYMPNSQMMPENANNVNLRQTAGSDHRFLMVNNNAVNSGTRLGLIPRDRMTQTGQTVQPEVSSTLEHCNSNAPYTLKPQYRQNLPNSTCGLQSSNHHSSEAPPPYCPVQKGLSSNQHSSEAPPPYCPVQKGLSSNQHSSEARPVQKGYYVLVSEDKSGKGFGFKVDNIVVLGHNADKNGILKGGLQRCSPNDVLQQEQCHQSSGKTSLQRHGQQSLPQTPASSSKLNDISNHTSPGHAGQKAVAVVQPLSQASYKGVSSEMSSDPCKQTTTTAGSGSVHEETSIVKPFVEHITKSTSLTYRQKSMDENVCLDMSTEEGADVMTNHDMGPLETSPNNLHAEEVESQPSGRMQATPTSHQPIATEVPLSQSEEVGKTKRPGEPVTDESELSSVPLNPLTYDRLTKLTEKVNNRILSRLLQNDFTVPDVASTILSMYWGATYENVLMKTDSYTNLINEVEEFCSKHVASDSVILSIVSLKSWCTKNNCFVLGHDDVHPEKTYTSSWLNINEQLDDIDKEFDFPWSLKYGLTSLERDEQPTQIETENGVPEHASSELQNEGVPPTEITALSDDQYVEKQASSARDGFNQTPVPLENTMADSIDSSYSFKIHVLPPEEARILFDKLNSEQVKTEKTEDHSEMIINSSVEDEDHSEMIINSSVEDEDHSERIINGSVKDDMPEIVSVRLGEVKLENKVQALTQEFCCTTRWMEVMGVSNTRSLCNCQCRREQSADGITVKSFDVEKAIQAENSHVMKPVELDPVIESEIKVDIGNDVDNQTLTPTWMKQYENLIDLTEEDEMLHSHTNMEPKRILLASTPSVDSNIIVREINDLFSCSETELSILTSELEVDCGQSEQKRPGPAETQFNTKRKQTLVSEAKTDKMTFLSSLSLAQKNLSILSSKNNLSLKARRKRKRRAETPDSILPFLKKMYLDPNSQLAPEDNLTPVDEPFNANCNTDDLKPIHNKFTTVKLALFGSLPQKEHGTLINSHSMSSRKNLFSNGTPLPPTTISVTVAYLQKGPTELAPMGASLVMKSLDKRGISEEPSETGLKLDSSVEQPMLEVPSETGPVLRRTVRQRIHEEWKIRLVPTKRKSRGRCRIMTLKKRSFASSREVRREKTKAGPPTVTEGLPVASEGQSPPGTDKTKQPLSAQRREALLNRLRLRVAKSKMCGVTKPADIERSKYELGNPVLMPLQENNVLRFSVLPKTFTFNHGPGYTESTDPHLDIPDPGEANGKDSKLTAKRLKGAWAPDPAKKYTPLPSLGSQVVKTTATATFQEYQKKYKEKRQPSDE